MRRNALGFRADATAIAKPAWHQRPWLLGAAIGALWLAGFGPWPRDAADRWDDTAAVQAKAVQAVRDAAQAMPPNLAPQALRAGVAEVEITSLAAGRPLAGYGRRAFQANEGVAEPLFIRALAVHSGSRRIAFVSGDLLLATRTLAAAAARKLAVGPQPWRRDELYFGASHTHSGPGGHSGAVLEIAGLGLPDEAFTDGLANAIAAAVRRAESSTVPCEFAAVSCEAPAGCIANRTQASGEVCPWIDLLLFRHAADRAPLAAAAVFSAHATALPTADRRLAGDYPAAFAKALRPTVGPVLFFAGAVGSMGPDYRLAPRAELAESLGRKLAEAAAGPVKEAKYAAGAPLAALGLKIPLPRPTLKAGPEYRLSPFLAELLLPQEAWLHGVRLGDRILLGTPADFGGVLANQLRGTWPGGTVVATSFNGDYVGYVLPDECYDLPKYEPQTMVFYGPHSGEFFQAALREFALALAGAGAAKSATPTMPPMPPKAP